MLRRAASFISIGLAIGFGAFASTAGAVPAYPDAKITLEQPSGEKFTAGLYGDEWSGGYETLDGYAIEQDRKTDRWEYAKRSSSGRLVAGGTSATKAPPPGLDRGLQESRRHRVSRATAGPAAKAPNPPNTGTQPTIVILASFTDQASLGTTAGAWASRFFGASDSVSDYYDEVSFGDLDIAPGAESSGTANDGVVGWVNIGTPHPGSDDPSGVITTANQQTFKDAVAAANPFVDFSSFDTNGNGTVSPNELHITVITAGYEASICGAGPNSTWGHKWSAFAVGYPVADTKTITDYTMFGEAHCGGSGAYMATLGIMVHEIGHDIDWPDYYDNNDSDPGDTGTSGDGGVGQWSVMATGSWAAESGEAPGETPPHPDAFNKYYQGWISPTVATGTSTKSMGQAATNPDAVQVLDNPGGVDWTNNVASGTGEYFLIENRQQTGYDAALPGCGILIWHVDETRPTNNNNNGVDSRRLLDLEEADGGTGGLPYSAANAADAFLGGSFNAGSNPNSNLYNGSASGVSVSSFSSTCAATMSASVTGPGGGGNNPPVLAAIGNKNATVGNELSFQVSATDADADALTYSASNLPAGANFNPGTRTFTWTPAAAGTHPNVHFEVSDGTDEDSEDITINVTGAANNPPVLAAIGNKNATVGNELSFQVSATDADADALTYSASNLPAGANFNPGTRTFTWTPAAAGTHPNVHFEVSDGTDEDSEDITINVTGAANNPPVLASIGNKNATVGNELSFQVSATDADADALTYSASNLPAGANFNPGTRTFTWTPAAAGSHPNVHFEVTDGTDEDSEDITINVTGAANNPPVLAAIGNKNATVGNELSFQVSATDADADALTYSASNLPAGANFNPGTRTFTWTPAAAGSHPNVHFEVTDGTDEDSEDITINVTGAANNPPVLAAIGNKNATVGNELSFQVSATDADADALTYSASNLPAGANFNPGTRTFTWTPAAAGSHPNVHFEVSDGTDEDSEDITINVTGGGDTDPPETTIDSFPKDKIKVKKGKKGKARYEVSANEPATIEGRINGGQWQGPFEPGGIKITDLSKGSYTIEFRATDTAGNVDATPASDTFEVKRKKKKNN